MKNDRPKFQHITAYLYEYIEHESTELYEIFINYQAYVLSITIFNPMLKLD